MNVKKVNAVALVSVFLLSGCATIEPYPAKRPMTSEGIAVLQKVDVAVAENTNGVEKSWFMTDSSAAGAGYGLIGALVTATMDAIMNAGPEKRATKAANEIAELLPAESLNASLLEHLKAAAPASSAADGIVVANVSATQKLLEPKPVVEVVEIATSYVLSEDASAFRFTAQVTYESPELKYSTPYQFKKAVPKSETTGPFYSNVFTYYSAQLPVPTLTTELKEQLIASINSTYQTESGQAPDPSSQEGKAMAKELVAAKDGELTKDEIAIFLTREWLKEGGNRLRQEVANAHAFTAKYIVADLNHVAVPSVDGQDELLETQTADRTVRRIGSKREAGSYVSSPGNVAAFTTYGNARAISLRQQDKIKALREQAKVSSKKSTKA